MKKRIVTAIICTMMMLSACGAEKTEANSSMFESTGTETATQQKVTEQPVQQSEAADNAESKLTEQQAYEAVINYNKAIGSGYDGEINSEGYSEYWDVSTNEGGEIVVLYRSYTGAQIRYYVDPATGDTYVTELVPGIIDEEQKTDETFNARDYLTAD